MHELRLPYTPPRRADSLFGHLAATAVPGVEEWRGGTYRRTLRLAGGPAVVALRPPADPFEGSVAARIAVSDEGDLADAGGAAGPRRAVAALPHLRGAAPLGRQRPRDQPAPGLTARRLADLRLGHHRGHHAGTDGGHARRSSVEPWFNQLSQWSPRESG